ncbi:MAG: hypothetical protein AAGA96_20490 [Verrucomicrobiota bacterium]
MNPQLEQALEKGEMRFFRASRGAAKGRTGAEDTAKFADNLMVLQECAILLGEKLDMNAVSSVTCHEGDETVGFCFDPNSNPQNPAVAGAIINRRMPIRKFVQSVRQFIDQQ